MKGIPQGYKFVRFDKPRTEEIVLDAKTGQVRKAGSTTETYHVIVEAEQTSRPFKNKEEFMPFWNEQVTYIADPRIDFRIINVDERGIYILMEGFLYYDWKNAHLHLMFVPSKKPFGVEL
jgi:hypothetical protein